MKIDFDDLTVEEALELAAKTAIGRIAELQKTIRDLEHKIERLNASLSRAEDRMDKNKSAKLLEKAEYEIERLESIVASQRETVAAFVRDRKQWRAEEALKILQKLKKND